MSRLIEVFPNSGHHIFWVPFEMNSFGTKKDKIRDKCLRGSRWYPVKSSDAELRWLRFRFASRRTNEGQLEYGAWVGVETNLGGISRGPVVVPYEAISNRLWKGQTETPYAYDQVESVPKDAKKEIVLRVGLSDEDEPVEISAFTVRWIEPLAANPIDVDLVIDFGNTRTVALLLEYVPNNPGNPANALISLIKPLSLTRYDEPRENGQDIHIFDSWFVLKEPEFAEYELPNVAESSLVEELFSEERSKGIFSGSEMVVKGSIKRMPQIFVEASPVVVGPTAKLKLPLLNFSGGGVTFLSSPKRYAWDSRTDSVRDRVAWTMTRNLWNTDSTANHNPKLASQVLRYFPANGTDWDISDPPTSWPPSQRPVSDPQLPIFPRADALTWMALALIEAANRQINSRSHWENNHPYVSRRVRSVIVTHPSGWTGAELNAYKAKWKKAANCFAYSHLVNPIEDCPSVEFPIDEAVAAQLPIIFSEVQGMQGYGENWLEVIGRPNEGNSFRARIMNIDIGGGTTDFSVVEYEDTQPGPGVSLESELLFKDSSTTAGDAVVQAIIERVLLPALRKPFEGTEYEDIFQNLFSKGLSNNIEKETWKRITRLVLIPKAVQWMEDLANGREPSRENTNSHGYVADPQGVKDLQTCAVSEGLPSEIQIFDLDGFIETSKSTLEQVIEETIGGLIGSLSKYVAAFDVDLVIISGKPSELPIVTKMLQKALPISFERIISVKDFPVGNWYPFAKSGKISDAKSVTAVGLALYQAIKHGRIPQWHISTKQSQAPTLHYWMLVDSLSGRAATLLLPRDCDVAEVVLMPDSRIGRRLLPAGEQAEPTYILRWIGKTDQRPPSLRVTLKRIVPSVASDQEYISIESVTSNDARYTASMADVSLEVCTLLADEHWIDAARFQPGYV